MIITQCHSVRDDLAEPAQRDCLVKVIGDDMTL